METKNKKERTCINIDEENILLLKWLKINFNDNYSFTVNNLITRLRNEVTKGMTEFEIEQFQNLKIVGDRAAIDIKKVGEIRSALLMEGVENTLKDKKKREAIKTLFDSFED